jgi:hypothetical protein
MNSLKTELLQFQNEQGQENEQSPPNPPLNKHSYITHLKIKSETEFWQACYLLQCQEPYNRPFFFFFWTKLLKCWGIQMDWVTKLYKYCTPVPAGAPARSVGNNTGFSAFGRRKEIFWVELWLVCKRGGGRGTVGEWELSWGLAASGQWWWLPPLGGGVSSDPTGVLSPKTHELHSS